MVRKCSAVLTDKPRKEEIRRTQGIQGKRNSRVLTKTVFVLYLISCENDKTYLTYHSLCCLPREGHHIPGRQRIFFVLFLFSAVYGQSAYKSYVNTAVRLRESDVNVANVINSHLILLWELLTIERVYYLSCG